VFLSYNREDQAVARIFAERFEGAGLSVWWDVTLRSGEAYDAVTEEALRGAGAVVVLWSRKSVVSRWVRAEATLADRNRTLAPARIEPCDLPIMFELTQTADLSHWGGEAGDPAWIAFLRDVQRIVEAKRGSVVTATAAPAKPPTRARKPSLAVLPFINRSGEREDDVFADCMVEDLSAALSLSRRIKVIAASATMAYRNAARDLRAIGRELDVRYLLEGNVRRVGGDLRVTAQLEEAESGDILWTRKFDRPIADITALQEDLVVEVAGHLGVQLERAEMEHVLSNPDVLSGREAIMRSDALVMGRPTPARLEVAIAEARRAVELAPDYGAAHAALAGTLTAYLMHVRGLHDAAIEKEILEHVAIARASSPGNPLVLCRIAAALAAVGQDEDALLVARRAVTINPTLEIARTTLSSILLRQGCWQEALAQCDAAERNAPNGMWTQAILGQRSAAHFQAGQYDTALAFAEQGRPISGIYTGHFLQVLCLARLDRRAEAAESLRHLRHLWPEMTAAFAETYVLRERLYGCDPDDNAWNGATIRDLWRETGDEA